MLAEHHAGRGCERVILFKTDGSLCVHAEKDYKSLNGDYTT